MSEGSFEGKKHAYRQTQDGVVVSFVVHPSDVSPAIAMAPLGTRFMVAFAEIGDDENRIENNEIRREDGSKLTPRDEAVPRPQANEAGTSPQERGSQGGLARAAALSPEERSAIASQGAEARWKPKRKFSDLSLPEQAGIRCEDAEFQKFITAKFADDVGRCPDAATAVRHYCCVDSRANILRGCFTGDRWNELEHEYQTWLTDAKYAEARR